MSVFILQAMLCTSDGLDKCGWFLFLFSSQTNNGPQNETDKCKSRELSGPNVATLHGPCAWIAGWSFCKVAAKPSEILKKRKWTDKSIMLNNKSSVYTLEEY